MIGNELDKEGIGKAKQSMYKVSEYSNNNQEREDASMKEENIAIEIDTGDGLQDNDYNMSAEDDIVEKPTDSINEGERIGEIEDELLSSGDEDLDAEMHKIGTGVGGDAYRNSVVEFNSEDEIENLEEDESIFDRETENINEDEKGDYLSNDSVVELDELNNFEDHDDVQEIPPPFNNSIHKREDSGYNNQETLEVKQYDEFIDENDRDENEKDKNDKNENADDNIKEIEVNAGANQEILEDLNNEGLDKDEHDVREETEKNDVKNETEEDDDEEKEEEEGKKEEDEEIEVQGEQQEDYDGKPVNEDTSYSEVRKNENSTYGETGIEGIIEYNKDENEGHPNNENIHASPNIDIHSKVPNSKLECTFPIIINIAETDFLLVPFDKHRNSEIDVSHLVSLYDDNEILKLTLEEFFGLMRTNEDLNEIHQFTVNKELVLVIPELNLSITEDNIYSRDITIEDFIVSFENLKYNSINDEKLVHKSISFLLTSQTRFITNFNNLTESIRKGKGFDCVNLEHSALEPIAIVPEALTEDSHKRQSLDSNDETDTRQTKRVKVSI